MGLPKEPVAGDENIDGESKVGGGVKKNHGFEGFCATEPPACNESKQNG